MPYIERFRPAGRLRFEQNTIPFNVIKQQLIRNRIFVGMG